MIEGLRVEVRDRVLSIVLDRQERKNALSTAMRLEIERICASVDGDGAIDVVVLRAVGPVFCAGADMKEIGERAGTLPSTDPGAALRSVAKPVICAVDGACVTGGLELALSCDLIIASDRARFADTHVRLGVLPRWGMSALLPRAIGLAAAKEMTLTGRFVEADEALRLGLVTRLVPHDGFDDAVDELARTIAAARPAAVLGVLDLYDRSVDVSLDDAVERERAVGRTFSVEGTFAEGASNV